ncbi:CpsD/CapB family tyrosine-protein kinase [Cohnella sp. JJ-181]|uniref:CpsD/CapB family tyrosine-protein kinase n=1 Tax=Cohnella rhizoplanae TaxID=2974897 RepID=UPI0022FF9385|nr:CpsD/CapB family tyrosine-protein kinase [Cohnella sp. JJ-181]CAI6036612.1 Tyrosine-protein kinase YwqD [Cohnella sp. JJ-181]
MTTPALKSATIMDSNPFSPVSETYHTLRANIEFLANKSAIEVLTVTSTDWGEGRTTTAVNLALAYSRSGKKVLLIDADLRRPALHAVLGQIRRNGLSNYLANQQTLQDIVKESGYSNLHVITAGDQLPGPTELLSSGRLSELFEELRGRYDRVIVDASPLTAAADAQIVAAATDGVVMVVAYASTKRAELQKTAKTLSQNGTPLLGIVLNKAARQA